MPAKKKPTKTSNKENEANSETASKKQVTTKRLVNHESSPNSSESSGLPTPKKVKRTLASTTKKSLKTTIVDTVIPTASPIVISKPVQTELPTTNVLPTTSREAISESTQSEVVSQTSQKSDKYKTLLKEILNNGKMKIFPKKTFTIGIF